MAEYLIKHKLLLPERFNRDPATFLIDGLVDHAAKNTVSQHILLEAYTLIEGLDLHDQPVAKLYKAIADNYAADHEPALAIKFYSQADARWPKVGVKNLIKQQQKQIKP